MVSKENIKKTLETVKSTSTKRKFKQAIDLIINVKDINLKKPEQQVDTFVTLAYPTEKKVRICAFVGPELAEAAKKACDTVVLHADFAKYKEKTAVKKLAKSHDFFISQANIMPDVAKTFGRVLGPRGKMPNPKAGCVVPSNANLAVLVQRLQKLIRVTIKTQLSFKCSVGNEDTAEEQVIDNIITIYSALTHALPQEEENIKNITLKLSMGKPVMVGK